MMQIDRAEILRTYGDRGVYVSGSWKEDSDKLFTPHDARIVYQSLSALGYLPLPFERFVFISPSSNIPTHEYAIWQEDSLTRKASNLFIAGDLQRLAVPEKYKSSTMDNKHFYSIQVDASNFPTQPEFADLIWDRKGWIWHSAYLQGNSYNTVDTIKRYKKLLKSFGSIVLDNIDGFMQERAQFIDEVLEAQAFRDFEAGKPPIYRPSDIMPGATSQYERSTVELINRNIPGVWPLIEDDFYIQDVGTGKHRVRVLTKK